MPEMHDETSTGFPGIFNRLTRGDFIEAWHGIKDMARLALAGEGEHHSVLGRVALFHNRGDISLKASFSDGIYG